AFAALEGIAAQMKDWHRVVEVLERRVEVARAPEQKPLLKRLAGVLAESLGRAADAAEVHRRLLDVDPEDAESLLFRARHLWTEGDKEESARHWQRLLEVGGVAGAVLAEAHLRLGQWGRVV